MSFWRNVNPTGALADFRTVFRDAGRHRWRFAALAAAMTIAVFSVMWQEAWRGPPARPTISYITTWEAGRTDAQISESNKANQKRKDELAAELARREEARREMYRTLGRYSGMDVDAIDKKAQAERAAEDAARKQQQEEALRRVEEAKREQP